MSPSPLDSPVRDLSLCDVCRAIDFSAAAPNKPLPKVGFHVDLGSWDLTMDKRIMCSFCCLIFEAVVKVCDSENYVQDDPLQRTRQCTLHLSEGLRFTDAAGKHKSSEKVFKVGIEPFWPLPRKLKNVGVLNRILLPRIGDDDVSFEDSLNCARRLKSGAIDFEIVKAWIQQCGS